MLSVSATCGCTSSADMPKTSANCIDAVVRVPPTSTEPSMRFTVPSGLTTATAAEGPLALNQKPEATPRPRLAPSKGVL